MKSYSKIDENTIQVDEVTTTTTTSTLDYDSLIAQRDVLVAARDEFIVKKNQEIADLDAVIKQADKLGVVSKF